MRRYGWGACGVAACPLPRPSRPRRAGFAAGVLLAVASAVGGLRGALFPSDGGAVVLSLAPIRFAGHGRALGLLLASCVALALAADPATAQSRGQAGALELTLKQAIFLALKNSRAVIGARLGREEQKFSLEAAEERYDPMAGSLSLGTNAASRGDETADISIGPSLRVPTGGSFRLSLRKPLAGERDREASTSLSFSQPLLKGFGTDIDTQPLRRARGCRSASTSAVSGTARPALSAR